MSKAAGAEQRAHERRPMRVNVEVRVGGRPPLALRSTDICVGGIGLVAAVNPPLGLQVDLRIPIPTKGGGVQAFEVRARVIHAVFSRREDGFRVGLAFLQPSDKLIVAVGDFLGR